MDIKRYISGLIGFPLLACIFILGNKYIVDVAFSIIAVLSIYEFYKSFKVKNKPIEWLGYAMSVLIAFLHIIPECYVMPIIGMLIPLVVLILFLHVILSNMKINVIDMAVSLFGISYIAVFTMFLALIYSKTNGKILIWYVLFSAWGTDVLAYLIGKNFGKHKLKSSVSPNKSVEGCIAGIFGSIILVMIYTIFVNNFFNLGVPYIFALILAVILSIVGQVGDLAASSVKRYNDIKDFSHLIPGHGGMLDRFDSVIFIAPFAYFLLSLI